MFVAGLLFLSFSLMDGALLSMNSDEKNLRNLDNREIQHGSEENEHSMRICITKLQNFCDSDYCSNTRFLSFFFPAINCSMCTLYQGLHCVEFMKEGMSSTEACFAQWCPMGYNSYDMCNNNSCNAIQSGATYCAIVNASLAIFSLLPCIRPWIDCCQDQE